MKLLSRRIAVLPVVLFASSVWMTPQIARASPTVAAPKTDNTPSAKKANDTAFSEFMVSMDADALESAKLMSLMQNKSFDRAGAEELIKAYSFWATFYINDKDKNGATALIQAATFCTPEAVSFLLKNGANPNIVDAKGETALMKAARRASPSKAEYIVAALIAANADLNLKNSDGKTAAELARKNFNTRAADNLVKVGAANAALWNAAEKASGIVTDAPNPNAWNEIRAALDQGAAGRLTANASQCTALHFLAYATKNFDKVTAKRVLDVSDVNAKNNLGSTALHIAAGEGNEKMVVLLIAAGAQLSPLENAGQTPLDFAGSDKYPNISAMLRKAGAKTSAELTKEREKEREEDFNQLIKIWEKNESTAKLVKMLSQTQETFDFKAAEALLKSGADIDGRDANGATPLALACRDFSSPVVEWLLKNGAKPNLADDKGETALMVAVRGSWASRIRHIVEALIAAGADVNLKNSAGETALKLARANGQETPANALVKAGAIDTEKPTS